MGNNVGSLVQAAIQANETDKLAELYSKHPEWLDKPITDDGQSNAATRAAYSGKLAVLQLLASLGADLDWRGPSGMTPLLWAAARGHADCCQFLLANNCSLTQTDASGLNARALASRFGRSEVTALLDSYSQTPYACLSRTRNCSTKSADNRI